MNLVSIIYNVNDRRRRVTRRGRRPVELGAGLNLGGNLLGGGPDDSRSHTRDGGSARGRAPHHSRFCNAVRARALPECECRPTSAAIPPAGTVLARCVGWLSTTRASPAHLPTAPQRLSPVPEWRGAACRRGGCRVRRSARSRIAVAGW